MCSDKYLYVSFQNPQFKKKLYSAYINFELVYIFHYRRRYTLKFSLMCILKNSHKRPQLLRH